MICVRLRKKKKRLPKPPYISSIAEDRIYCQCALVKLYINRNNAQVESVQFWFQIFLFVVYAIVFLVMKLMRLNEHPFQWRWTMPLVGILLACADWLYFKGLSYPDVPVSVASLLRRVSVVMTFVLGARFFNEKNIWRKALALAVILAGVAILCLAR